jgi:uncharacterized protein YggE
MRAFSLILLLASAALAQANNGVVTSVSRTVAVTPDEGDFTVVVTTALNTTQQQIIGVFQEAGVQNLNVVGQAAGTNTSTYPPSNDSQLYYQITFTVAPPALPEYARKLDALRAKLPGTITGLQYAATLNASQAAVETAHQAVLPQLMADARAKAQLLATAAGLKLGAIQGVSESSYGASGPSGTWYNLPTYAFISTTPSSGGTQTTFFATVTFSVAGQ